MNQQSNRPPMTPKVSKRIAPITPVVKNSSNKAARYMRQPQTAIRYSSPMRCTPTATTIGTPDRFIPNRARTDVAKARRALLSQESNSGENSTDRQREYQRLLRQALWGQPDVEDSLMSFGSSSAATPQKQQSMESPYRQDMLRSPLMASSSNARSARATHRTRASIDHKFSLQAPDLLEEEDLNLISYGPMLAVALEDRVFLWKAGGSVRVLTHQPGYMISCVRWSEDHKLLAIGFEDSVQIWAPENNEYVKEIFHDGGFATALAWNGMQLIAANSGGLIRYDLGNNNSLPIRYEGHGEEHRVTSLVFNQNIIASAGGGTIKIWDTNQSGQQPIPAKHTMQHEGLSTLTVCPGRPAVLVSGGDNGIIIWNSQNGAQRCTIEMEARVRGIVWSPFNNTEMLVAHEQHLVLWSMGSKPRKIVESKARAGKIISMDRNLDGQVVLAHDDEVLSTYSVFQECHKEKKSLGDGTGKLSVPVIR